MRNSPSFQLAVEHGRFSIELHAWRNAEICTFTTLIYDKAGEQLLQQFPSQDQNEIIWQALKWCEENSR